MDQKMAWALATRIRAPISRGKEGAMPLASCPRAKRRSVRRRRVFSFIFPAASIRGRDRMATIQA